MKSYTVILNEQQRQTLGEFLSRTSLKGSEVPAFMGIMNALKTAVEIEQKPKTTVEASPA